MLSSHKEPPVAGRVYASLMPSVTTQIAFQQKNTSDTVSAPEFCLTWVPTHLLPFPTIPIPLVSLEILSSENWLYTNVFLMDCFQTKTPWELFLFHMPLQKYFFLNEYITKSCFLTLNYILTHVYFFSLCPIPWYQMVLQTITANDHFLWLLLLFS